jgi:hypothetical protein
MQQIGNKLENLMLLSWSKVKLHALAENGGCLCLLESTLQQVVLASFA